MESNNQLYQIVYDYYATRILFGYYKLGESLPTISKISESFQLSVPTVRTALALLEKNRESFSASNMKIIPGLAPEACRDLPAPAHAFLGGTSGSVRDILALLLEKNPHVRIVSTAVTLESVSALSSCMADFEIAECVSVQVSKASPLGRYHLMQAQNPVYIFTLQNGGTDA